MVGDIIDQRLILGEEMKNIKKALLIISFGSSYEKARQSIANIEDYFIQQYEDYDFFRVFTSRKIVAKLKKRDNINIDLPSDALARIYNLGYQKVVCQSIHVINGIEYEITRNEIEKYKDKFEEITLGRPLLTSISDYEVIVDMFRDTAKENEAILFMGHGTKHFSNSSYSMLEDVFSYHGVDNVYVATVEGFPPLGHAIRKMRKANVKKVTMMPFMIVAGDHANYDMAGEDEGSWKNVLLNNGFEVKTILRGLGEYGSVAKLFYEHSISNNMI